MRLCSCRTTAFEMNRFGRRRNRASRTAPPEMSAKEMIKRNLGKIVRHANTASCTARPRWEILSTSTATAEKSFTSADVACAYDRVWWLRSEQNSKKERNVTQQPMSRWHPGGIASRWPCKGIAVPLRVCWCSEYEVKASDDLQKEFDVMGFDPYCQMLLGFDTERLPGWAGPTETNEKRDVKWPLGLISSSSSWLP